MNLLQKLSTAILLSSLLLLSAVPIIKQYTLQDIKDTISRYNEKLPQEKVYLQLDKPIYKPGETIWLSGYLRKGSDLHASDISDIVYVDLLDPKGNVSKKLTLQVVQGRFEGNFDLRENEVGGNYKVKAYTLWMKNFEDRDQYTKELQVIKIVKPRLLMKLDFEREVYGAGDEVAADLDIRTLNDLPLANTEVSFTYQLNGEPQAKQTAMTNKEGKVKLTFRLPTDLTTNDGLLNAQIGFEGSVEAISRSIPIVLNDIDLQFFPEGGNAVAGVKGKVAFKALNEFGKPADIKGVLMDGEGNVLTSFESFHQGMGAFEWLPKEGEDYYAKITQPKGINKKYTMPSVMDEGFSLAVKQGEKQTLKVVYHSPSDTDVHLLVRHAGLICHSETYQANKGENEAYVLLKQMPTGVLQVTLLEKDGKPQAERLYFNKGDGQLQISMETDKAQYAPREEITLKVKTTDATGKPIPASLSLAVVDDKLLTVADDKQHNILSWLLMGSELKGDIEEPSFYFDPKEPKAEKALEYVMLTHGWRRYTWDDILDEKHEFKYSAEKEGVVAGQVINTKSQKPLETTVQLFEMGGKRRTLKISTDKQGRFMFVGVNPSLDINILAELPKGVKEQDVMIKLTEEGIVEEIEELNSKLEIEQALPQQILITKKEMADEPQAELDKVAAENKVMAMPALQMQEDVSNLEEVIVIGYGTQRKKGLTNCVVEVMADDLNGNIQDVGSVVQGQVAGVSITQAGNASIIRVRGSSTVGFQNEPLYVVDGLPVASNQLYGISPDEINSVSVIKGGEATALYGSRAVGGVIIINTKNELYGRNIKVGTRYALAYMKAGRKLSAVKEFYMPKYTKTDTPPERTDFRETIMWIPNLKTGNEGTAEVKFYNSDAVTTFRAIAEGIGAYGNVGRQSHTFSSQMPIGLDMKMPAYLTMEDTVYLPLFLKNNTEKVITGVLNVDSPLTLLGDPEYIHKIEPNETKKVIYKAVATSPIKGELVVSLKGLGFSDVVRQPIEVKPKGFPSIVSYNSSEPNVHFQFDLNDPVKHTPEGNITIFGNMTDQLMDGVAAIIREPYGCFEQVSSATYPNLMALRLMEQTGYDDPDVKKKALQYIKNGYNRLIAYETNQGGFEWFGHTPPHEALTAYGLLEFTEMQPFYHGVDQSMIDRTKEWLLSRKDGKGSFKQAKGKYDHFGRATTETTNAYIVYVMARIGETGIEKEYVYNYKKAFEDDDAYRMALMANAAFLLGKTQDGHAMMHKYLESVKKVGLDSLSGVSITQSGGKSLQIEIAALGGLAMLRQADHYMPEIANVADYLLKNRTFGRYGATQSTILALEFLTEYSKYTTQSAQEGEMIVYINDRQVLTKAIAAKRGGNLVLSELEAFYTKSGKQDIRIELKGIDSLRYAFDSRWNTRTPQSNESCEVSLKTELEGNSLVGNTSRLSAVITNKKSFGLPMVVAKVGIPSGLSIQPWQLKELEEKNKADFVEIFENYIVFYFTGMSPNEVREINLDLRAEIGGHFEAPASCAYVYYRDELKDWQAGERIHIKDQEMLHEN
ncbi:MG2 domain-containing protein [Limibacter armeniacum]|uniref:MG2 domain-containing protein n=1 Tax=Limibacter armeniacum TaxID=466084 RepID=UPI002FE699D6